MRKRKNLLINGNTARGAGLAIYALLLVFSTGGLKAAPTPGEKTKLTTGTKAPETAPESADSPGGFGPEVSPELADDGLGYSLNYLALFAGAGKVLKGYRDPLYVSDDKSDYLETWDYHAGMEFSMAFANRADMSREIFGDADYVIFGLNAHFNTRDKEVTKRIPKVVPQNPRAQTITLPGKNYVVLGIFSGFAGPKFGIQPGFSTFFEAQDEPKRRRYKEDGSGEVETVPGRGLVLTDILVRPNMRVRVGDVNGIHFKAQYMREQFIAEIDSLQAGMAGVFSDWYTLEMGTGLHPYLSVYHKSILTIPALNIAFHIKMSLVLNYYKTNLEKIALDDAWFGNFGLDYHF